MEVEWPVRFHQLPYDEVGQVASYRPQDLLIPALETLEFWHNHTELIKAKWTDLAIASDGERLTIEGYPLHPYTQKRIVRYLLGVNATSKDIWDARPDLLAEVIKHSPPLATAPEVQVRVVAGQVVYATDLPQNLGSHFEYVAKVAEQIEQATKKTKTIVGLMGYLIDPVWVHIRMLYLPENVKTHFMMGPQVDASYLFSDATRGRASVGLCGYSLRSESSVTMDNWLSARTPGLTQQTNDRLLEAFADKMRPMLPKLREKAKYHVRSLSRYNRAQIKKPWRQTMVGDVGRHYLGRAAMREVAIQFDREGGGGSVDLLFAMAKAMDGMQFERRIKGERELAYHMKTLKK